MCCRCQVPYTVSSRFSFYSSQRPQLDPAMVIDSMEHLGVKMVTPADAFAPCYGDYHDVVLLLTINDEPHLLNKE